MAQQLHLEDRINNKKVQSLEDYSKEDENSSKDKINNIEKDNKQDEQYKH